MVEPTFSLVNSLFAMIAIVNVNPIITWRIHHVSLIILSRSDRQLILSMIIHHAMWLWIITKTIRELSHAMVLFIIETTPLRQLAKLNQNGTQQIRPREAETGDFWHTKTVSTIGIKTGRYILYNINWDLSINGDTFRNQGLTIKHGDLQHQNRDLNHQQLWFNQRP